MNFEIRRKEKLTSNIFLMEIPQIRISVPTQATENAIKAKIFLLV